MIIDPYPVPPFKQPAHGSVELPGSKSISNRALILGALAEGTTTLSGMLFSRDTELMLGALKTLGIKTEIDRETREVRVVGTGGRIPVGEADLNIGNAGTAARFLTAFLCLRRDGSYRLDGDLAMRERPMTALLGALEQLGARFTFHGKPGHFPFTVETNGLAGGRVEVDASASSQFISALLMVAPFADRPLELRAPGVRPAFVQLTVEMMRHFGGGVNVSTDEFAISSGNYRCPGSAYAIEPDVSAASYFIALPFATGGTVFLPGLRPNMLQGDTAFTGIVEKLGARVARSDRGWEVEADVAPHPGLTANFATFSDTFLTLAAIAPLLTTPTRIEGIAHTRAQETDRIAAMATELKKLGCGVVEEAGSLEIHPDRGALRAAAAAGVEIDTYEDHRVAMSFGILGSSNLRGDGTPWLRIRDPLCCRKTFPDFFDKLAALRAASHV